MQGATSTQINSTSRQPETTIPYIGMALGAILDDHMWMLWRLTVNQHDLPGLWMVINREFMRVE